MSIKKPFKQSSKERRLRTFSESFKIKKVKEIESGKTKISDICKTYEVNQSNVYKWIYKYGVTMKKGEKLIVETESDTRQLLSFQKKIAELEQIIGQKQILIDFKDKMIELAELEYGIDIKKKFSTKP